MNKIKPFFYVSLAMLAMASCKKKSDPVPAAPGNANVIIVNEGVFKAGNGDISNYNTETGVLENNLFQKSNGRPAGDIVQSVYTFGDKQYIIVNGSNKIEVVDKATKKSLATIPSAGIMQAPQYMLAANINKAYVSDIYSNGLSVVDLAQDLTKRKIKLPGRTDAMLAHNNKLWVTVKRRDGETVIRNRIYGIDMNTDFVIDSITLPGYNPTALAMDNKGLLWVLCEGDQKNAKKGGIYGVDLLSKTAKKGATFATNGETGTHLAIDGSGSTLYFLKGDLFKMDINGAYPTVPFVLAGSRYFYGLGVHPKSGDVYLSEPSFTATPSSVFIYSSAGALTKTLKTGFGTTGFTF